MLKNIQSDARTRPLCVDLDGTLLRSDILVESVIALLKLNPLLVLFLPFWLMRSKAHLKQQIANRVDIDPASLPYNEPFLAWLRQQKKAGRPIILATASNAKFAAAVAGHLKLFDLVLASDADINLSGDAKLARLLEEFGDGNFDYAANANLDLNIWRHANAAIVVNAEFGVRRAVENITPVAKVFDDQGDRLRHYLRAMRPHQWLKNLLVFTPMVLSHRLFEPQLIVAACIAFVAFCLCASSVYLLNDIIDLAADRRHPKKRLRPFASGSIPVLHGLWLALVLLVGALALSLLLMPLFTVVLSIYYLTTLVYSLFIKQTILFDVIVLAGLFTFRLLAGSAAVDIPLSFWLIAFSMFLFFSLALVKRYVELGMLPKEPGRQLAGRGYQAVDLETLAHFGIVSGYMAVLVLALYIDSLAVNLLYGHPEVIWFLCPLVLYLVSRIWLLARRGDMHDDPVVFAIKDSYSLAVVALGGALMWAASL